METQELLLELETLRKEVSELKAAKEHLEKLREQLWVEPGHFYSPIPNLDDIKNREEEIFNHQTQEVPGVDLRVEAQLHLLNSFERFYQECPFAPHKKEGLRYYYNNNFYSYSDAITLYSMIRHCQPKKIIEVGSGFSSSVILDTNSLFFNNEIACTFIEPYPVNLRKLLTEEDKKRVTLIQKPVQAVELELFSTLEAGDILLIDSTHVSKVGSDVNRIMFEILPLLNRGVYIHFHDIFNHFEYPKAWIYKGRSWNENYILRAFLQYNYEFEVILFTNYILSNYRDRFIKTMPLLSKNLGGNIWLRRKKI